MNTVTELLQPVENDLDDLILELKNLIGAGHPILQAHLLNFSVQE